MIKYDTSSNLPKGNELVTSARMNTSYQVLRMVLRWILWIFWGGIIISGLGALSLGDKVFDVASSAGGFVFSNAAYSKKDIGPSFEKEMSMLELSDNFSATELRSSFNTTYAELSSKKEEYTKEAYDARAGRDQNTMNEATRLINATSVEIAHLTNAKNKLESRINEIDEERKINLGKLQAGMRTFYILMVALIVVIAALLVYALYQAAIVVIDIADCQVEIFVRSPEKGVTT